ncbi:histidinol-phosphate transaminase [Candidatus Micrarchaeota archaeon]|nr:histidinol-phosphate transaminase [Candidatus Micrarchaeota archaeon]
MFDLNSLVRKSIKEMKPYSRPSILPVQVKLNQNESPYNLPKEVLDEFQRRLVRTQFNLYNEGSSEVLRNALASKFKLVPNQFIVGCGIDEIFYYVLLAFVNPGDKLVRPSPSFSMYEICAKIAGAVDCPVQLDENFELTQEFVEQSKTAKITFICRPNNPTANSWSKATIEEIIKGTSGLVLIDEAYVEFAKETCIDFLKYPNVVLLRTFSKAYSSASVRLGYGISSVGIVNYLNRVRLPWNVNIMAQLFGEIALAYDYLFSQKIEQIKVDRESLLTEVRKIVKVFPSDSNFFLFEVNNPAKVYQKLFSLGVLVRSVSSYPMLGSCLRANVGTPDENATFVSALKKAVSEVDAVIFDIDGVLIDVSKSYREAIIRTVKQFTGKSIVDRDVDALKQLPGFNNDWDSCYALCKGIIDPKQVDRTSSDYQQMKDYFQLQYLGELIKKEKSLVQLKTLDDLSNRGLKFGVVTGRPREEAIIALRTAGITPKYIRNENIIAQEDAPEKPSPEPLLLAQRKLAAKNPVYVGDSTSDKLAAERAQMLFVFCKNASKSEPNFEFITINSVNVLPKVI